MLGFGGHLIHNSETIMLIADYYGEKQAMYFAFLIHHHGMMCLPGFIGMLLWVYQIYWTTQFVPEEEDGDNNFFTNYFIAIDCKMNYPFMIFLGLWGSIYIESWKRK